MARSRTIKPHFLQSMSMDKVSVGAQLTFVRLWLLADDAGRVQDYDPPASLELDLYPYQPQARPQVPGWLDELERVGCIVGYRAGGEPYLRIVNWRKHQRISHSTPSKRPGEPAAARGDFERASGTAIEQIRKTPPQEAPAKASAAIGGSSKVATERFAKPYGGVREEADKGPAGRHLAPVGTTSGIAQERFAQTAPEAAPDGPRRGIGERFSKRFSFFGAVK